MRHKGLLVIAALVAVPVVATLGTWAAWEGGAFDGPALPGQVEVSHLFAGNGLVGCTLRCTLPRTDLVGYTTAVDGNALVLYVTRRRLLAGRRAPKVLQVEVRLPAGCTRLVLRAPGTPNEFQIWPR
jgi:hypothetical protein